MAASLGANATMQLGLSKNAIFFYQTVLKFDQEQEQVRKQYRGLGKKRSRLMTAREGPPFSTEPPWKPSTLYVRASCAATETSWPRFCPPPSLRPARATSAAPSPLRIQSIIEAYSLCSPRFSVLFISYCTVSKHSANRCITPSLGHSLFTFSLTFCLFSLHHSLIQLISILRGAKKISNNNSVIEKFVRQVGSL